ncbi:MAG: S8 family serine peptidase [Oscillospiraceae bacterium]
MKKTYPTTRFLSWLLIAAMLCSFAVPIRAVGTDATALSFQQTDRAAVDGTLQESQVGDAPASPRPADTELVRVSIVLEEASTLEAGFDPENIAGNAGAMSYREKLQARQDQVAAQIQAVTGEALDIVWNLTLAANLISAQVEYGQMEQIASLPGVEKVILETRYTPDVVSTDTADPDMSTSSEMIGSSAAWSAGYTGAGSRIAVIDTGTDTDHQSFSDAGLHYALARRAQLEGKSTESYLQELDLLDAAKIEDVLEQLNIADTVSAKHYTAEDLFVSDKLPFGFNYIDRTLDITHDHDGQSEHGSHVAGIAAANAYIPNEDGTFSPALEAVHVQGVAPDAQIITMKVFGQAGGAYDSDYMAAIEDAVVLGCDAVNLSLGSGSPGYSRNSDDTYQAILDSLADSGIVATMSAGNSGAWMENSYNPTQYLYAGDVSMTTTGMPGTFYNALSVASVDNSGYTGMYLNAGGSLLFYAQTEYSNEPMTTLAGEQTYLYLDGFGSPADFAALGSAVQGKIVVCSRGGGISFYEKGNNAVVAGAVATVVYNNQAGSIQMDLTDYRYTAPFVSITQADGAVLRSNATAVTGEDGQILYYEGTLTVGDQIASGDLQSDSDIMSSFSSWGIPGSLKLKPEITAPGGNIYSVDGQTPGGQSYENMSGTSMAAPQVAGMVALAAEYIRESNLAEQTGLTPRQLAQSLLMSTAVPLREEAAGGNYWSILKQGAGLANIGAAISSNIYIKMDDSATVSASDGKVKAELGDDPQRTGSYRVSFALHNLTQEAQGYTLSADFFTQDQFTQDGIAYLHTQTTPLAAQVRYLVDGEPFVPTAKPVCDLDGDGDTDADDAQRILDYAAGLLSQIDPQADVDGDGRITTYDAYCVLDALETRQIQIPAGGSVHITAEIVLPEAVKSSLDRQYENGAYLEGYLYVEPVATAEGETAPVHSIPVLGFYGNWSDPSMYDRITYTSYLYGDTTAPYLGYAQTNNLIIKHRSDSNAYYQVGNPYLLEETYPEGKAAVRSSDTLYQYRVSLIRNAAALTAVITNQDGDVLYTGNVATQAGSAYYHTNNQVWMDTVGTYTMNRKVSSLGVKEGDVISVHIAAVPEFYETAGDLTGADVVALMEEGKLGKGAVLTTTMTVDDTAPTVTALSKDLRTGNLTVTAQDNQFVAVVQVLNASGSEILASSALEQSEAGQPASVTIDLSQLKIGPSCMVRVADYAGNESLYTVPYGGEPEDYTGRIYGFTATEKYRGGGIRWMELDPETVCYQSETEYDGTTNLDPMDITVTAAEYVDGYVYMAADDGFLYAAPQGQWSDYTEVGEIGDGLVILDMAFHYGDGQLYALGEDNTVYTVDLLTGVLEKAFTVSVTNPSTTSASYLKLVSLAIDDAGRFYSVNYSTTASRTFLYRWSAGDIQEGAVTDLAPMVNDKSASAGFTCKSGTLAWDHDQDILYWANAYSANSQSNYLLFFDLETGRAQKTNPDYYLGKYAAAASRMYVQTTGLYIVPSGNSYIHPTDTADRITISEDQLTLLQGAEYTLSTAVYPWNLSDKSVTWTTSDADVVSVDGGRLQALDAGLAVVTATTNAAPNLSVCCTVTVRQLDPLALSGLIYDAEGNTHWAEFSTGAPSAWTSVADAQNSYYGGAALDGMIYAHDGKQLYGIDPDTFETTSLGAISESWIWSDAAPAPAVEGGYFGRLIGLCDGGTKVEMLYPEEGTLSYFTLSSYYSADPMAAIAYIESGLYKQTYPAAFYYVLTESGKLWQFVIYTEDDGKSYTLARTELGATGLDLGNVSDVTGGCYASMLYDSQTGYLLLASYTEGTSAQLYAIDPERRIPTQLGSFGDGAWPVVCLYQYTRVTELTVRLKPAHGAIYEKDTLQLNAKVLPATYDAEVTWSSSDPSVATVDSNGKVTGVQAGTAVITATSVAKDGAGNPASASSTVTVKPLLHISTTVNAQITDETGSHWVSVPTAEPEAYQVLADTDVQLAAGGYHEGKIYGIDGDYSDMCNIYMVDPEDGFRSTLGAKCSVSYSFLDVAAAPAMELEGTDSDKNPITVTAFGGPLFISNARSLVYLTNYESGTVTVPSFDFARKYPDAAAIAFLGTTTYREKWPAQDYMVLCADGTLAMLEIYGTYVASEERVGYTLRQKTLGNVGKKFSNDKGLSMTYVNDGVHEGLIVAYSDGAAELYYIDLQEETLSIGKLGNVGDATAISAPYVATNPPESSIIFTIREGTDRVCSTPVSFSQDSGVEAPMTEPTADTASSNATGEAGGSLNALRVSPEASAGDAESGDGTVRLTLTETRDVTNGLLEIRYDPQILSYAGTDTALAHTAVRVDEDAGQIVFAYASAAAIPADAPLSAIRFSYQGEFVDTTLQVTTLQRNTALSLSETEEISLTHEDGGHRYQLTESREPTCTEPGARTYTCQKCGHSYTETVEALGHDFGSWETVRSADCFRDGQEIRSCSRCEATETRVIPANSENCPSKAFSDLDTGRWYHAYTDYAIEKGLMQGVGNGRFRPEGTLTRGMLVTTLYRLAGSPEVEQDAAFTDLREGAYYEAAVAWAQANGIAKGVTQTTFGPERPVTREQAAAFLYRYVTGYLGRTPAPGGSLSGFADAGQISPYAEAAVAWAVAEDFFQGYEDGKLYPRAELTRAQMAKLLTILDQNF